MKKTIILILFIYSNIAHAQIIDVVTGVQWPSHMELVGDDLYFIEYGSNSNILKINIIDPIPEPVFIYNTGVYTSDFVIHENRLFYIKSNGNSLYEIDLNDPTPKATQFVTGLANTTKLLLNGADLYISESHPSNKIMKVNINDPNPELFIDAADPSFLGLDGDILYIVSNGGQLMQINIMDPNPEIILNTGGVVSGMMIYEDQIYLSYIFQDKISRFDEVEGLVVLIYQQIVSPTSMMVIEENLYFSQYDANKISKVDVNLLPLILNLSDNNLKKISVYPNPALDYLSIEGLTEQMQAKLYDIYGRIIKSVILQPLDKFSIVDLQSGLYFLKFDGFELLKFIKK